MQQLFQRTFWLNKAFFIALIGAVVAINGCASYLPVSKYNFIDNIDPNALVQFRHKNIDRGAFTEVVLEIEVKNALPELSSAEMAQKHVLWVAGFSNYSTRRALLSDTLNLKYLKKTGKGKFTYSAILKKPEGIPSMVLLFYLDDKTAETSYYYDVPVNLKSVPENKVYFTYQADSTLVLNNASITGKPLLINGAESGSSFQVKYFKEPFLAALPPFMSDYVPPRNPYTKILKVEAGDVFTPDSAGLYFFQTDTTESGFFLLARNNAYPKITRTSELSDPLLYITKREEREKLAKAQSLKPVLDQFWLEVGGSKENARRVIRNFYEQVEFTNKTFSSFKDGWRTDRGLIYIIFGKPDVVTRFGNREEWLYKGNANFDKVSFTFIRKPTIFTADNFELVRDPVYQDLFYSLVDLWRRGVVQR